MRRRRRRRRRRSKVAELNVITQDKMMGKVYRIDKKRGEFDCNVWAIVTSWKSL